VFLLLWLLAPVAFFSLSQSKLPGYIVPALPAGTLLLAEYIRRHAGDGEASRPSPWLVVPHALLASALLVPGVTIQYLVLQNRMPWSMVTWVAGALALLIALGTTITLRGRLGLRALRFVTLVPVVLTVAAILKIGAPALEAKLSSRPVAEEIQRTENGHLPVAVFGVQRETEYGLHFYRNQVIVRYEVGGAPAQNHILVVPLRRLKEAAKFVDGRKIAHLGSFPAQQLEYFWIGPPAPPESH
jgi:4-amino-4-deoxy-L-arabinose transferase-like glycosyltransferase